MNWIENRGINGMNDHYYTLSRTPYLEHHGVKGQKWGVRKRVDKALGRRDASGKLTQKGKKHLEKKLDKQNRKKTGFRAAAGLTLGLRDAMTPATAIAGAAWWAAVALTDGMAIPAMLGGMAIAGAIGGGATYASGTVGSLVNRYGEHVTNKKEKKIKKELAEG